MNACKIKAPVSPESSIMNNLSKWIVKLKYVWMNKKKILLLKLVLRKGRSKEVVCIQHKISVDV